MLLILFSMFISFLILYNNHVILTFMTSQAALDSDQIRVVESGWAPGLKGRGFKSTDLDFFQWHACDVS